MKNELEYKGYKASVGFSAEDELFVGRVNDIDALIMFSGSSVDEIKAAFVSAVDDYLADCAVDGVEPEKAYKGSFNVRVGCAAHRKAVVLARSWKISLNEFVRIAIEQVVDRHQPGVSRMTLSARAEMPDAMSVPYPEVIKDEAHRHLSIGGVYDQQVH